MFLDTFSRHFLLDTRRKLQAGTTINRYLLWLHNYYYEIIVLRYFIMTIMTR